MTAVLLTVLDDSTFRFQGFFPTLRAVERSLPGSNGFEVFAHEALILRAIHSAIMAQPFSGSNRISPARTAFIPESRIVFHRTAKERIISSNGDGMSRVWQSRAGRRFH